MTRPFLYATLILFTLIPTAVAPSLGSWTTSASTPASFRPNRVVTFTYTVMSTSPTDLPVDWMVHLWTCTDSNADNQCTGADARLVDWTEKRLQANANAATSVTWSVTLPTPEASQLAYFAPRCTQTPCTGPGPSAADTKAKAFQLQYTNTWTRTLFTPALAQNGTTGSVTYHLVSTNLDDADLAGSAEIFTTPNASVERSEGTRAISVLANTQQTLTWNTVAFAPYGRQQERVVDSTTAPWAFGNASVLEVHLHAVQPRASYVAGATLGLYFTLDGHGMTSDPTPLQANVQLVLRNGTFALSNTTTRPDANGTLYAGFQSPADLSQLNWTANTTVTWNSFTFAPIANGTILFTDPVAATIDTSSIDALRQDLANQSLHGVHLDDMGTHNLLIEIGRIALYAALIAGAVLLLIVYSFRA